MAEYRGSENDPVFIEERFRIFEYRFLLWHDSRKTVKKVIDSNRIKMGKVQWELSCDIRLIFLRPIAGNAPRAHF